MYQSDLIVKPSLLINGILITFFTLVGLGVLLTFFADGEHDFSLYFSVAAGVLCPLFILVADTRRRRIVYRVNRTGLYYYEKLVTDWHHFHFAYVDDLSPTVSVKDDIRLCIQYYDDDLRLLEQKLPAPLNLDHSVSDIIAAIEHFRQPEPAAIS